MPKFTPQQVLKRQIVIYPIAAVAVIAGLWIYWAVAPAFAAGSEIGGMPGSARLAAAILGTMLVPIGLAFVMYKTSVLVSRGEMGEARVIKFGSMTSSGRQAMTFSFVVAGKPFTVTQSVRINVAEQYATGMKAPVIYDSTKPSRAQVFASYNPHVDASVSTVRETAVESVNNTLFTVIVSVLCIAQWVIAIFTLHLVNDQFDIEVYAPASLGVVALTVFEIYLYDLWTNKVSAAYEARFRFGKRLLLPLAILSVVWTGWATISETQRIAHDEAAARQADADRAAAGQQQRDFAASMQTLQKAMDRRNDTKSVKP